MQSKCNWSWSNQTKPTTSKSDNNGMSPVRLFGTKPKPDIVNCTLGHNFNSNLGSLRAQHYQDFTKFIQHKTYTHKRNRANIWKGTILEAYQIYIAYFLPCTIALSHQFGVYDIYTDAGDGFAQDCSNPLLMHWSYYIFTPSLRVNPQSLSHLTNIINYQSYDCSRLCKLYLQNFSKCLYTLVDTLCFRYNSVYSRRFATEHSLSV